MLSLGGHVRLCFQLVKTTAFRAITIGTSIVYADVPAVHALASLGISRVVLSLGGRGGAGLLRSYEPATAVAFAADLSDTTVA
ncbi:hypothetical protein [Pseudomonas phage Lodos]